MEINTSIQLGFEQALKALIPYLQGLDDPDGVWDFLDAVFPEDFLFLAGHEAKALPDDKTAYLGFIATLPDLHTIGPLHPAITVKMQLGTAGISDANTRDAATVTHSRRAAALVKLFSRQYQPALKAVLNPPAAAPDDRPWKGIGVSGWEPEKPESGKTPTGTAFLALPSYIFIVHFESEPTL